MNLFEKYGIKEVADVTFYSITKVGDEEFYTPVLVLDTLKVSSIEKTAQKTSAQGGKGNKKLISWNYGKEISLNFTDALFTPASLSLAWGGTLETKLSPYTSAIVKINIANKYAQLHYSTKAYPSPALTDEEWEIVYRAATEYQKTTSGTTGVPLIVSSPSKYVYYEKDVPEHSQYVEENREELKKRYLKRTWIDENISYISNCLQRGSEVNSPFSKEDWKNCKGISNDTDYESWIYSQGAMPEVICVQILNYINELKKLATIETDNQDIEVIDRMEKFVVTDKKGLKISTKAQKKNLLKFYRDDRVTGYIIYYDAKTMLPLLNVSDEGIIKGWQPNKEGEHYDKDFDRVTDTDEFVIKQGTVCYKATRTIKYKNGDTDGVLGKKLVINADTFPEDYRITGETYVRNQKTGKDQRCQFIIYRAAVSTDTNISLEAEGDPTTFDMQVDVLAPPNDVLMDMNFFNVDEDYVHGGTRIVPTKSSYTHTPALEVENDAVKFTNEEIY